MGNEDGYYPAVNAPSRVISMLHFHLNFRLKKGGFVVFTKATFEPAPTPVT